MPAERQGACERHTHALHAANDEVEKVDENARAASVHAAAMASDVVEICLH